jgi:hypothetical protein
MFPKSHIVLCFCLEEILACVGHSIEFLVMEVNLPICQVHLRIKIICVLYSCWYGGYPFTSSRQVKILSTMTNFSKSFTQSHTLALFTSLIGDLMLSEWNSIIVHSLSGFPCVQLKEHYLHIEIHAVPWILFFPIGGFLSFVINLHYYLLIRGSLSYDIYIWCTQDMCFAVVLLIFYPIYYKSLAFYYSSCWMMGDALIPSFQRISSH